MCVESRLSSADMSRSRTLASTGRRGSCSLYGTADIMGINSSTLHGYHTLSEYIVARHPLAGTEAEFWKMVWDENSSVIVCLSGPELPPFWPSKPNEVRDIGWLHVSHARSNIYRNALTRFEFLLTSDREDYALACTLWRFHGWPSVELENDEQLALAHSLLDLASHVVDEEDEEADDEDGIQRSTGPIVVVDNTGGGHVGTFCALRILINQLTHEFLFDVYFVFKMLCFQRPRMFQSHLDLEFIYALLQQYLARDATTSLIPGSVGANGHQGPINNSFFSLSSPSRLGFHCRRRTKVMVNHLFPHRHKSRTHNAGLQHNPRMLGSQFGSSLVTLSSSVNHLNSLLTGDLLGDEVAFSVTQQDNALDCLTNHGSTLPSTGLLESISHESSTPADNCSLAPSLPRTMSTHSQSVDVAAQLTDPTVSLRRFSTYSLPTV
ncbi:hypothetical protein EG68_08396 [Paragonimus skrjabini miyazakii]|uniref:Tyrosine-protein phosphatase domain-containing protein n=1 Tax=Paragonimus skrjabini miyazakii TaxID=59628 RepID=A0A8S9YF51_9TREM|nr:hypothetical protein EG68_08396 [Paragonimus skrjabini miyazakii]